MSIVIKSPYSPERDWSGFAVHSKRDITFLMVDRVLFLQIHFNPLEVSSILPEEQLLVKLNKEIQLNDAASSLQVSFLQGDTLRHQLTTSLKSMRSQTRQSKTALHSAMEELSSLKTTVKEERQNRKKIEAQLLEQHRTQANIDETLKDTKTLLMQTRNDFKKSKLQLMKSLNQSKNR